MKAFREFVWTTLLGGVLLVLPLALVALLVRHAVRLTREALGPLAGRLPSGTVAGILVVDLVAFAAFLLVCFVAGLFVRTRSGRTLSDRLERVVLRRVPGYVFLRGIMGAATSRAGEPALSVVQARFDDAWVLAFLVERHADGLCTIFVPGSPTPTSGSVYFMEEGRIKPIDAPVLAAMGCMMRLGYGSRALLEGRPKSSPRAGGDLDRPGDGGIVPSTHPHPESKA